MTLPSGFWASSTLFEPSYYAATYSTVQHLMLCLTWIISTSCSCSKRQLKPADVKGLDLARFCPVLAPCQFLPLGLSLASLFPQRWEPFIVILSLWIVNGVFTHPFAVSEEQRAFSWL